VETNVTNDADKAEKIREAKAAMKRQGKARQASRKVESTP
jgi:hypothetical protein